MRKKLLLRIALLAAALLVAAVLLHSFRGAPPSPRHAQEIAIPPPPPLPARVVEAPRAPSPGRSRKSPDRLIPFLEKVGRARLVRDRRTLAALRSEAPPIFEEDLEWIRSRLSGELLGAAGAAELVASYRSRDAVGDLAAVLGGHASSLLKDVVIETLASLGGDGAAAALVLAARNDPDEGLRARAAGALGGFAGPEAYAALAGALRDPSAVVRSAAASALSRLPSRQTVDQLLWALSGERDPRIQADLAIGAFAAGGEPRRGEILEAILARPALVAVVQERQRAHDDSRYRANYSKSFFDPGQPSVLRPPEGRQIGITIETGPGMTLEEVTARLFGAAPLDRYRAWFRIRRAEEFPSPQAYDSYGSPAGDVPYDEADGTVFIRYRDPRSFEPGVLGFTKGCSAFVSDISMLHEFGHAFARLGDEYPRGSTEDAANLAPQGPPAWMSLVRAGLLPDPLQRDPSFLIPSADCHMSNRPTPTRFCPVCQLELHARMWELAGAPLPW